MTVNRRPLHNAVTDCCRVPTLLDRDERETEFRVQRQQRVLEQRLTCGRRNNEADMQLAERTGLEPATPGVTGRYSNQLNYRSVVGVAGLEPATYGL